MYDHPDPQEQLAAVTAFLREQLVPRLEGQLAFHARVAANMLDIVERQIRLAPAAERDELNRLHELLGVDGTVAELNRELCQRIADGRVVPLTPGLMEHLWLVTLDKLAVDQPRYDTLVRLLACEQDRDA